MNAPSSWEGHMRSSRSMHRGTYFMSIFCCLQIVVLMMIYPELILKSQWCAPGFLLSPAHLSLMSHQLLTQLSPNQSLSHHQWRVLLSKLHFNQICQAVIVRLRWKQRMKSMEKAIMLNCNCQGSHPRKGRNLLCLTMFSESKTESNGRKNFAKLTMTLRSCWSQRKQSLQVVWVLCRNVACKQLNVICIW